MVHSRRTSAIPVSDLGQQSLTSASLRALVVGALENHKARDILTLDVEHASDFTDYMVLASGTSNRHVKALVDHVLDAIVEQGIDPLGVEGRDGHEWVLVDLGDVVVHVMQPAARAFYDLERLWAPLPRADGDRGAL